MHFLENTSIQTLSVHYVGNRVNNESLLLTEEPIEITDQLHGVLLDFFGQPFKSKEYYHFSHPSDVQLNEVYSFVSKMFQDYETSHNQSIQLAKHLYRVADHANIKGGEFYVAYFKNVAFEGETVNCIGLFKTENKDVFLQVDPNEKQFELTVKEGINIDQMDKGCLIFNTEKENGYVVSVVDKTNSNQEAQYWVDHFLQIEQREDAYFQTQNALSMYRSFVLEQLPAEFEIEKVDQAELLNRSMDFFKTNDHFSEEEFKENVLQVQELQDSFTDYKRYYQKDYQVEIDPSFEINDTAVKKQQRFFKSVIKLDKNFHIYVHGDRSKIERGSDGQGKYYKLYFNEENF